MSHSPSSWRGNSPYARRHEPAQPVGGSLPQRRTGTPLGLPPSPPSGWRVLREALFWIAVFVLGAYAVFAPVLPEGGPL